MFVVLHNIVVLMCLWYHAFVPALPSQPKAMPSLRWVVQQNSSITVKGESNVNKFQCVVTKYMQPDTLFYQHLPPLNKIQFNGRICVDVVLFDCHNKYMTGDMRKTLRADVYPQLKITFLSLEQYLQPHTKDQQVPGRVEVELAGVKKHFIIDFSFRWSNSSTTIMHGEKRFLFTDFGLTPPQKMAGMIKVKNEFNVVFHLELKQV